MIPLVNHFFSADGVIDASTLLDSSGRYYCSILFWADSYFAVLTVLLLGVAAGILFMCGCGLPWTTIVLYVIFASFHERNPFVFSGAEHLLRILLLFFMFAPRHYSLGPDNSLPTDRGHLDRLQQYDLSIPWAQRMMQIQVTVVYMCTALAKLQNEFWREGTAMYYVFGLVDFNVRGVEQLMNYPLVYMTFTYASLVSELAIPVMLWFRRTRPWAIGLGVGLHLWMMCFMTIPLFSPLMVSSYVLFLSEDECLRWVSRIQQLRKDLWHTFIA